MNADSQPPADVAEPDPLAFTPVPGTGNRHDGWTPRRQADFIAALAVTGRVSRACRAVGMSRQSAYQLRERGGADSFAAAWDVALQMGYDRAFDIVMERAMHGVTTPRYYKGRQIGTITRPDTRLLMAVLGDGPPPPPRRRPAQSAEQG